MASPGFRLTAHKLYRIALASMAIIAVAVVLVASAVFFVVQNIGQYRDELALRLEQLLGQPVSISGAQVSWRGPNPILRVDNLRLYNAEGSSTIGFDTAEVHIDFFTTFRHLALHAHGIRVMGATVEVTLTEDGQLRLLGIGSNTATAARIEALERLLYGPATLTLAGAKLLYHPRPVSDQAPVSTQALASDPPIEFALDVTSESRAEGRSIHGALQLPGQSQNNVSLMGKYTPQDTEGGEHLALTITSASVPMRELKALAKDLPLPGSEAVAQFKLTATIGARIPLRLRGEIAVTKLRWAPGRWQGPTGIATHINAERKPQGWRIIAHDLTVSGAVKRWQAVRATAFLRTDGRYSATLTEGRLEDLLAVLAFVEPDDKNIAQMRAFHAVGEVKELVLDWHNTAISPIPFTASARLQDISWPPTSEHWGVEGFSGSIWMTHERGVFEADISPLSKTNPLVLTADELSAKALIFDTAEGRIDFDIEQSSVIYSAREFKLANEDFGLTVNGAVISDEKAHELLDLRIEVAGFDVPALKPYLPSPAFNAELNDWLADSLKTGRVRQTRIELRGRSNKLEAAPNSDSVRLQLQFDDFAFSHALPVPELATASGTLRYQRGTVQVEAAKAKLGHMQGALSLTASGLGSPEASLNLTTALSGTAQSLIGIVGESTAIRRSTLRGIKIEGTVRVKLEASRRLVSDKYSTKARLSLKNNRLEVGGTMPPLKQLSGELTVTDGVVSTKNLAFHLLDRPVEVAGTYALADTSRRGHFKITTKAPAQFWLELVATLAGEAPADKRLLSRIKGQSDWTLAIDVAKDKAPHFTLRSSLIGTRLELPAFLAKPASVRAPFTASAELRAGAPLHLSYADFAHAAILMPGSFMSHSTTPGAPTRGKKRGLAAISVRLGSGQPPPLQRGRWRISGRLPTFDLAELQAASSGRWQTGIDLSRVELDLYVQKLAVGAAIFRDVHALTGKKPVPAGVLALESQSLAGFIRGPTEPGGTVTVNLERLTLADLEQAKDGKTLDPRSLPALSFNVKRFSYGGRELGTLKFVSRRLADGITLDKVYLIADGFDAQGQLTWRRIGRGDLTTLAATVHADDLASLIHAIGQDPNSTEGGATEIAINAAWNTSPAEVDLGNMTGEIRFHSSNGRLLHLGPGPGARIFGLLNLQSLPQLMVLDIGAVFEKGFAFDRLHGHFSVEGGNAYTNDLVLESQAARIDVVGRTGLVAEDYDQQVKVTPHVSGSLPIAGAALGGVGAGVGAVIWLAEKVLDTKIVDEAAASRYHITGPWSSPAIERLVNTETEKESAGR